MLPWQVIIPALLLSALVVAIVLAVAARTIRSARPWVVAVAIGVAVMPLAIVVHNLLGAFVEGEEGVSFIVAILIAPLCIAVGLVGGAVVLLRERRDLGLPVSLAASGLALFALLSLLSFIVTTLEGGEIDWLNTLGLIGTPLATMAAVAGALWSVVVMTIGGRTATA